MYYGINDKVLRVRISDSLLNELDYLVANMDPDHWWDKMNRSEVVRILIHKQCEQLKKEEELKK